MVPVLTWYVSYAFATLANFAIMVFSCRLTGRTRFAFNDLNDLINFVYPYFNFLFLRGFGKIHFGSQRYVIK